MRRRARAFALPAALTAGAVAAAGCGGPSVKDVRATILDEQGEPVPGAVFYAEAYDDAVPFAFLSARSGTAGEVPDSAREPLKLPWRAGAKVALAAFAEGYRPTVLRDPAGYIESDGALLVLVRGDEAEPAAVAELGFPFEGHAGLAEAAAVPGHAALREAFARARGTDDRTAPLFILPPAGPAAGPPEEKTLQGVDDSADS
ncbi:MAG: hypothetical protein ACT4PE_05275 [Candidatus Eiseniibacteriota bacterium]